MISMITSPCSSKCTAKHFRVQLIYVMAAMAAVALEFTAGLGQTIVPPVSAAEARQISQQAYTFAYPLVLMEMTRRAATVESSTRYLNHFIHAQAFPDDHFRQVIRPNADTLYSSAWLDLAKEPVLLHVPDTKGR